LTLATSIVVAACGGQSPSAPTASSGATPATSARAPVQIKVLTFNIQHGLDGSGRYNLQRAIDTIARIQPDVVGLQELTRNHPSYACEDQPAGLSAGLRAATGQRWEVTYQQEWFTPDVSCQASGRGDGPETEGLALITRGLMSSPAMTPLFNSRIGLQISLTEAYRLPVVVTHLINGTNEHATRARQAGQLAAWAGGFGEPQIVLGDFNSAPEFDDLSPFFANYRDAWVEATKMGRATGNGITHKSVRIDYIFYKPGGSLTLQSAEVVETRPLIGVEASDHKPLLATFTIR
jgi:endonuclease/exonuclease/phosphatase family metal-dependent hydrolase